MKNLKVRELKGKTIEEWFTKRPPSEFQQLKTNYVVRYKALKEYLVREVHPYVATGAAVYDGIFLNNHGPEHIETVIERATSLLSLEDASLSPYEIYLLLAAIQLHDAGNILGRKGHETRLAQFQGQLEGLLGDDAVEKRTIRAIAQAHGGRRNGDQDTIRHIVEQPVLNQTVRARLLAALLRFADEIADDSRRASSFAITNNALPESSRLHHRYSACLHSVVVDTRGKAIDLHYALTRSDVEDEFLIDGSRRLLVDEILARTLKMHRERSYCMRFLRPLVQIDSINVKLNIYESNASPDVIFSLGYRLEDHGYPAEPTGGIYALCPDLNTSLNGGQLNGDNLLDAVHGVAS